MKFIKLLIAVSIFSNTYTSDKIFKLNQKNNSEFAKKLLQDIKQSLNDLRAAFLDVLAKNSMDEKRVNDAMVNIETNFLERTVEELDDSSKKQLKQEANRTLITIKALFEEAAIVDLWMKKYDTFVADLDHNFRHLPNKFVAKPDYKKLYEELGFKIDEKTQQNEGQKASITTVRKKYQNLFDQLKKVADKNKEDFDSVYFDPYLRAIDYAFRTPYSKMQYDTFLQGKSEYDKKADVIEKYKSILKRFNSNTVPAIMAIKGILENEILNENQMRSFK